MSEEPKPGGEGAPGGRERDTGSSAASYAGIGVQFVVAILLFLYLGKWLDARLGTAPWLLITGTFVGAAAGFYSMYRKLVADAAADEAKRRSRR